MDHCHYTGLLRAALCRSCNQYEGCWSPEGLVNYPAEAPRHIDLASYWDDPPVFWHGWMWDLPDWWCYDDTAAMRHYDGTVLDYLIALAQAGPFSERTDHPECRALILSYRQAPRVVSTSTPAEFDLPPLPPLE